MIATLIRWSLRNRLFVLAAALLLLGYGSQRALEMPVDVFPDLTAPRVTVLAEAPGLAPGEMETLVTLPIESALNGATGVRRISSSTGIGSALIWAEFDWGTDVLQARQVVAERLQLARAALPPDIPAPTLAPVTSIMGEILFIALRAAEGTETPDLMALKTYADTYLRRPLLAVPGVAQVVITGGETRQYQVLVDPVKLANYRLSLDQVSTALRETNENASAGFLVENGLSTIQFAGIPAECTARRTSPPPWWTCERGSRCASAIWPRCASAPPSPAAPAPPMASRRWCWPSRSNPMPTPWP